MYTLIAREMVVPLTMENVKNGWMACCCYCGYVTKCIHEKILEQTKQNLIM